jgi:hypothetical protein
MAAMANKWAENLAEAKEWAAEAKSAEERKDWVDALACWEEAHNLALGDDFRDECWSNMQRVQRLANEAKKR